MNSLLGLVRQVLEPCRIPARIPIPVPIPRTRAPRVIAAAVAALAIMTGLSAVNATAAPFTASRSEVDGRLVDVQVQVDGWPAPLYVRPGAWDKNYFQAFRGKNYSLVVRNNTNQRVGVLIAVDGLNVVDGKRSSLSNREAMYVLDPYERATINGWRTSLRDVRRFVFVDEERSYASRTDQANGDMGWIRVLSFREDRPVVWHNPPKVKGRTDMDSRREGIENEGTRERSGEPKASAPPTSQGQLGRRDGASKSSGESFHSAPQADNVPGTGWGRQEWDPVGQTHFVAVSRATDHLKLRYEYASGLRALGIFIRERRVFQRERGELGFAQPPRW